MAAHEQMTPEEWQAYLAGLFPREINGIVRPDEPISANLVFSTVFPQLIRMDPDWFEHENAFLRQLLSNDHQLDVKISDEVAALRNGLTQGKNIKIEAAEDGKIIISVDGDLGINMIKRDQAYAVGDVAFAPALPTWARLDCATAGVTAAQEPVWGAVARGQRITDGTVVWIVRNVRYAVYAPNP